MRRLYQNDAPAAESAVAAHPFTGAAQAACGWILAVSLLLLSGCQGNPGLRSQAGTSDRASRAANASALPGISGLAWAGSEAFLAVHDAKYPAEAERHRVSLITLSASGGGWAWTPFDVDWPSAQGPSSDLESVARIPSTQQFLLVESGGGRKPVPHVYLARRQGRALIIQAATAWPTTHTPSRDGSPRNVEGSVVAQLGQMLVFVYAERSEGEGETTLGWSALSRDALRRGQLQWGSVEHATLDSPSPASPGTRLVSAMETDHAGRLYVASSRDPGSEDGPYQSAIWEIGHLVTDSTTGPAVQLTPDPCRLATLDGLKTEGLAVRAGSLQAGMFIGTDDERFGAVFRPLPIRPCSP